MQALVVTVEVWDWCQRRTRTTHLEEDAADVGVGAGGRGGEGCRRLGVRR